MIALQNKKLKLGNKGFTLVELIVVIAILAVLTAILAPQFTKYIEKSRVSADEATADEIARALQVVAADRDYEGEIELGSDGTITIDSTGVESSTGFELDGVVAHTALANEFGLKEAEMKTKSNKYSNIVIKMMESDGVYTTTVTPTLKNP